MHVDRLAGVAVLVFGQVIVSGRTSGRFAVPTLSKPAISGVMGSPSSSTIVATWTTSAESSSSMACGTSPGNYDKSAVDNSAITTGNHRNIVAGLLPSTTYYCRVDSANAAGTTSASFSATPADVRAPAEIETACFRIAQEALNNIASHARAHHVEVTLTGENNDLELMIGDDGVGFSVEQLRSSLGLVGMRERAELVGGRLDIESAPGAGTTLRARFPLHFPERASHAE